VLAEWLASYRVTPVGMESTGCYWKPLCHLLEGQVGCWLLNAAHLHNVPGCKTDIADAAWIAQPVDTAGQPPARRHLRQGWQEYTVRSAVRSYVLCAR
jgi:transposase